MGHRNVLGRCLREQCSLSREKGVPESQTYPGTPRNTVVRPTGSMQSRSGASVGPALTQAGTGCVLALYRALERSEKFCQM